MTDGQAPRFDDADRMALKLLSMIDERWPETRPRSDVQALDQQRIVAWGLREFVKEQSR